MRSIARWFAGSMMLSAFVGAAGLAYGDTDVSPYDSNPQCMERSATNCVIDDGPPPYPYIRRYRKPVINGPASGSGGNGGGTRVIPGAMLGGTSPALIQRSKR